MGVFALPHSAFPELRISGFDIMMMMVIMVTMMTHVVVGQTDEEIRDPPTISDPLTEIIKYEKNDSVVTVQCKASGTPEPTFKWHFEGALVTDAYPTGGRVRFDSTTGDLVITKLAQEQTGRYRCRASNSFTSSTGQTTTATAMSPTVQVSLAYVAQWPQAPQRTAEGTAGQYLALRCDDKLPAYGGPTEFKWYRRSQQTSDEVFPDDRIFIDKEGTLHFSYLLITDDRNNLPYSCAISNALFGNIVMGNMVDLIVNNADLRETGPTLQYPTNETRRTSINATRGSTAVLQCFFSGYHVPGQAPSVVWSDKSNNRIVSGVKYNLKNQGRILEIVGVDEVDEGPYFCQGKMGTVETERVTVMLNVTAPPIWNNRLQSQTVPEGRNAVFNCDTRSMRDEKQPDPPVWYRNGELLQREAGVDPARRVLSNMDKTLTLMDVKKDLDIACYQCIVRNSVGETFGSGCLNVILPIKIIAKPAPEQIISQGDRVDLTVVATADPLYPLSYEWTFKNGTYKGDDAPPFVYYNSVSKLAYLNTSGLTNVQMKDISGLYRRRVYHPFEGVFVDVMVKLRSKDCFQTTRLVCDTNMGARARDDSLLLDEGNASYYRFFLYFFVSFFLSVLLSPSS